MRPISFAMIWNLLFITKRDRCKLTKTTHMKIRSFFMAYRKLYFIQKDLTFFQRMFTMFLRRSSPADTRTSQRRRKNVLFLVSKTCQIGLKWKSRRPFFKTSSRRLPGNVLKTSSRRRPQDVFPGDVLKRSKISSRLSGESKGPPGDYLWIFYLHTL